ncbi:MAG: mechanosensitive ion channel family protein [Anaerolineae bacterium]|nr:mechanosensitive ion channel family protein [Anaerolineae bacterium]
MNPFDLLHQTFLGNTLARWGIALSAGIGIWVVLRGLRQLLVRRLARQYAHTQAILDDLVYHLSKRTWVYLKIVCVLYIFSWVLDINPEIRAVVHTLSLLLSLTQIALWGTDAITLWTQHRAAARTVDDGDTARVTVLGRIAKVVLWGILLLLALDNVPGIQVNTLIASLGIGSMAVALAAQSILSDLFASLTIVFDKPFEIGDFISVGDYTGAVEHIGLKSTRLRSTTGEQLVFSNSDLLGSRIRNYKHMTQRRVTFSLGVSPETSYEKLTRIPGMLQAIVEAQPETKFERAHFKAYGDFTLDFEVVYIVLTGEYLRFMDTQQAINLGIYRQFAEAGIELPYPTQTLLVAHKP